jgi:hypothetical protein
MQPVMASAMSSCELPDAASLSFREFKAGLLDRHEKSYSEDLLRAPGGNLARAA